MSGRRFRASPRRRWLLSSLSSIPGNAQHVAEAAMRRFLEAFVYRRNHSGEGGNWACSIWDLRQTTGDQGREIPLSPEDTERVLRHLLALKRVPQMLIS